MSTGEISSDMNLLDDAAKKIALARELKARDERERAETLLREALLIRRRILAANDPAVATAATHLGRLLEELGRLVEAEPLYREAVDIFRAVLPAGHPHLILGLRNLVAVLDELGGDASRREAGALLSDCVAMARGAAPVDDLSVAECLSDLGAHLADEGQLEKADPLLSEALAIHRRSPAAEGAALSDVLVRVARLRRAQRRATEAEAAAREALEIRERIYPPDDFRVAKVRSLLGAALTDLERFDEAERLLLAAFHALDGKRGALGAGPSRIADTVGRMAMLYESWSKPAQAAAWRRLADRCSGPSGRRGPCSS